MERHESHEQKIISSRGGNAVHQSQRVTFLIDASGSMCCEVPYTNQTRLEAVCEASNQVVNRMNVDDTVTINLFADRVVTIARDIPKDHYNTTAVNNANRTIGYRTSLWTSLWVTTEEARAQMNTLHQVVLFTDGGATDGNAPIKQTVVNWLEQNPPNIKVYFITAEISAADKSTVLSLPASVVKLIEINQNFNGTDLARAFGDVSNRVKQSYSEYSAHMVKRNHDLQCDETQSAKIDPNVYAFLTDMARIYPSSAPLALQLGASLTQQAVAASAGVPPPPPTSSFRAIGGSNQFGHQRLSAKSEQGRRNARPAPRERKWAVMSDKAGYAISQAKHLQIRERYNVSLRIPQAPFDMSRPVRQEWVIARNDVGSVQSAYEELNRIVAKIKTTPRY